jgi:uncharacterized OB-fold protein
MSNSANSLTRPLPELRNAGAEYWRAASKRVLLVPLCRACGKTFWHPRSRCPYCAADRVEWKQSSGNGVVHTFTIVRQSPDPFFKTRVPYVVAMVQLDDGPLLMSNIAGCDVNAVKIGMRVSVTFEPATDDIAIPIFRPEHDHR